MTDTALPPALQALLRDLRTHFVEASDEGTGLVTFPRKASLQFAERISPWLAGAPTPEPAGEIRMRVQNLSGAPGAGVLNEGVIVSLVPVASPDATRLVDDYGDQREEDGARSRGGPHEERAATLKARAALLARIATLEGREDFRLPQTFVERAVRTAVAPLSGTEPQDVAVGLSVFEGAAIRAEYAKRNPPIGAPRDGREP